MRTLAMVALGALWIAALAPAAAGAADAPGVTPADWLRRPTEGDLMAVFPTEAFKKGKSGKATISCTITPQGALRACVVRDESPAGMGFGSAAIALTPQFMMKPATRDGAAIESQVVIPINFRIPSGHRSMPIGSRKVIPPNLAWAEAPSFADVAAVYPEKARTEHRAGRATLGCHITDEGLLKNCQLVSSEPRGFGFDQAARFLAKRFRLEIPSEEARQAVKSMSVHLLFTFDPSMLEAGNRVIGKPTWAARPGNDQLRAAFETLKVGGAARVVLNCTIEQGGRLGGCTTDSETPAGAGVGAAALSLATTFRLATWTAEGLPTVGGTVRIPIRYENGPAPEPAGQ